MLCKRASTASGWDLACTVQIQVWGEQVCGCLAMEIYFRYCIARQLIKTPLCKDAEYLSLTQDPGFEIELFVITTCISQKPRCSVATVPNSTVYNFFLLYFGLLL